MATVNYTGYDQGSGLDPTDVTTDIGTGIPYGLQSNMGILKRRVDCSKDGITGAAADVYEAIYIPAGTLVLAAWMNVITAETTAVGSTAALGITGHLPGGFVTAVTCATTGLRAVNTETDAGSYAALGGYYTGRSGTDAANTIDIVTAVGGFTELVVDVYALVVDMVA